MLTQNFKSAPDLGLTEPQKEALMKTLVLLETGKLRHITEPVCDDDSRDQRRFSGLFTMNSWAGHHSCGTVCCIGGTAELIGDVQFVTDDGRGLHNFGLDQLFCPHTIPHERWIDITPAQAATALRSYLTTGDAHWDLAIA